MSRKKDERNFWRDRYLTCMMFLDVLNEADFLKYDMTELEQIEIVLGFLRTHMSEDMFRALSKDLDSDL
ncbi:hypothetical protein ACI2KR_29240 [Pseudomonas luteola]